MNKNVSKFLVNVLVCISLIGCQAKVPTLEITRTAKYSNDLQPGSSISTPHQSLRQTLTTQIIPIDNNATSSPLSIITSTPKPKPSPTIFWITIPPQEPVSLPTAKVKVEDLLISNGGCQLPCWWGFEPGKTKFSSAVKVFSPISSEISIPGNKSDETFVAYLAFPVSETISPTYFWHRYIVVDGVIQRFEVWPGYIDKYNIPNILHDYGDPDEVKVNGLIDPNNFNPITIIFYYSEKGIVARYDLDGIITGDKMRFCVASDQGPTLILWKPETKLNFMQFAKTTDVLNYLVEEKFLYSLSDVPGLSLSDLKSMDCIDTPLNFWPTR